MIDSSKILVVIPTYKEEKNILPLCEQIRAQPDAVELLFVDDNSPDQTRSLIEGLPEFATKKIHLMKRAGKLGLASAYIDGFRWGLDRNYDYIVQMDADLSHQPKYLTPMLAQLTGGKDFVIGSRYTKGGGVENWSVLRKLISRCGGIYARVILGTRINDFTGGYNGWTSKCLKDIDLSKVKSQGYSFQIELKYRAAKSNQQFSEVPIIFPDRENGASKMSKSIVLEAIWRVWALRFGW